MLFFVILNVARVCVIMIIVIVLSVAVPATRPYKDSFFLTMQRTKLRKEFQDVGLSIIDIWSSSVDCFIKQF